MKFSKNQLPKIVQSRGFIADPYDFGSAPIKGGYSFFNLLAKETKNMDAKK